MTFSQDIPARLKPIVVSFPHLYLASQRAKSTIEIINTDEAPLSVKEKKPDGTESHLELSAVAFGPGPGRIAPTFAQCADFEFDDDGKQLRIKVRPYTPVLDCDAPLLMRLNTQQLLGRMPTTTTFSFYAPALTARHCRIFNQLSTIADSDSVSVCLLKDDDRTVGQSTGTLTDEQLRTWVVELGDPEFFDFLYDKGPSTPFPYWCPSDVRKAIESRNRDEWEAAYKRYTTLPLTEKEEVTSLTLRIGREDGHEYSEEFFGIIPGLKMRPPKVGDDSTTSQEEVDRLWEESDQDCMVAGSFSADEHELAQRIRDWVENSSQPFPIGMSGDPPSTPVFRSRCEIIHRPRKDRLWYAERRLIIRVRPINDEERWNVEGSYWKSRGDEQRESIIAERLMELRANRPSNSNSSSPLPPYANLRSGDQQQAER